MQCTTRESVLRTNIAPHSNLNLNLETETETESPEHAPPTHIPSLSSSSCPSVCLSISPHAPHPSRVYMCGESSPGLGSDTPPFLVHPSARPSASAFPRLLISDFASAISFARFVRRGCGAVPTSPATDIDSMIVGYVAPLSVPPSRHTVACTFDSP